MNGLLLRGGGLPLADDDAGALDFLHEGVPIGELRGREGVRLDVYELFFQQHIAYQPHVLETKATEFIGYQRHIDVRRTALLVAGIGTEQHHLPQRQMPRPELLSQFPDPL